MAETEDPTEVEGFVGAHHSYQNAANEVDTPVYPDEETREKYERFGTAYNQVEIKDEDGKVVVESKLGESVSPFASQVTIDELKAREEELEASEGTGSLASQAAEKPAVPAGRPTPPSGA